MPEISSISRDDISKLLERLRKELFRRSGWDSHGNPIHDEMFRHYNLPVFTSQAEAATGDRFLDLTLRESIEESGKIVNDDEYGDDKAYLDLTIREIINLSDSEIINAFQGHSLIGALIKICDFGDLRQVKEFDLIPGAFDKKTIESYLDILEADEFSTKTPHCRSACTGLCMNGCTDTCLGSCVGECASCSVNCVGGCHTTCTGCVSDCGTNCGVGCGAGCSGSASGCAGCYSHCTGCAACSESCIGHCTSCSNQCTSCLAGCYGSSGYNNTCGCGGSCTTGCGGKASTEASSSNGRTLIFYHDKKVYGVKRITLGSNVSMPAINYLDNPLTPTGIKPTWIDEDGNIFAQKESVRVASSVSNYNQLKASGIKVTKSSKFRSVAVKAAAEKIKRISVHSGYSYEPKDRLTTVAISVPQGSPYVTTLDCSTTVMISSFDGMTGLGDENSGVRIDGKFIALPYSYHHTENTKIEFINGRYSYTYKVAPVKSLTYTGDTQMTSYFVPNAHCYIGNSGHNCEYEKNPNVGVYLGNARLNGTTLGFSHQVTLRAQSVYNIHRDGTLEGLDYNLTLDEYRAKLPVTSSDYITLYGDTDAIFNAYVCDAPGSHKVIYKIPLTEHDYVDYWWLLSIPSREVIGFDSTVKGLSLESYDKTMKKISFNSSIILYARQDFYLYPMY